MTLLPRDTLAIWPYQCPSAIIVLKIKKSNIVKTPGDNMFVSPRAEYCIIRLGEQYVAPNSRRFLEVRDDFYVWVRHPLPQQHGEPTLFSVRSFDGALAWDRYYEYDKKDTNNNKIILHTPNNHENQIVRMDYYNGDIILFKADQEGPSTHRQVCVKNNLVVRSHRPSGRSGFAEDSPLNTLSVTCIPIETWVSFKHCNGFFISPSNGTALGEASDPYPWKHEYKQDKSGTRIYSVYSSSSPAPIPRYWTVEESKAFGRVELQYVKETSQHKMRPLEPGSRILGPFNRPGLYFDLVQGALQVTRSNKRKESEGPWYWKQVAKPSEVQYEGFAEYMHDYARWADSKTAPADVVIDVAM